MSFGFVLYAAIQLDPLSSKNRKRQILWYHENTNGCFCQLAPCAFVFSFCSPHHVLFLTWILVQSVLKQAVTQHQLVVDVRVNIYRVSIQGDEEGGAWCKYHTITILPYFAGKFFSSSILQSRGSVLEFPTQYNFINPHKESWWSFSNMSAVPGCFSLSISFKLLCLNQQAQLPPTSPADQILPLLLTGVLAAS